MTGPAALAFTLGLAVAHAVSVADVVITREDPGFLVGRDAAPNAPKRELWRVKCAELDGRSHSDESPCMGAIERVGDVVVYVGNLTYVAPDWSVGVLGLDAKTGRVLYRKRTDFEDALSLKVAADDARVYALCWSHVVAFDAKRGEVVWDRRLASRDMSPTHGTQLVAGRLRGKLAATPVVALWETFDSVHVVDAKTGRDIVRIPWASDTKAKTSSFVGDLEWTTDRDGSDALLVVPMWSLEPESIALVDAANGTVKWRSAPALFVPPALVDADADVVYVRVAYDNLHAGNDIADEVIALDKKTGARVWRWPLGRASYQSFALVAHALTVGVDGHAPLVFTRADGGARAVAVDVSGVVRMASGPLAGAHVKVNELAVVADEDGRYHAHVDAIGAVTVRPVDLPTPLRGKPPWVVDPQFVDVDNAGGSFTVDFAVTPASPWPPD